MVTASPHSVTVGTSFVRCSPCRRVSSTGAMALIDVCVANSSLTAGKLVSQGWHPERIVVIHPPVDRTRFHPGVDGSRIRRAWTRDGAVGPVLLSVTRLDELGKGIDTVMGLLPRLRKHFPDIRYVLVGDGPSRRRYEALARSFNVAPHVIFAGRVADEELPGCYAACDLFLLLTRPVPRDGFYEGFGIVYREAMACGKPVVVSNEAGTHDIIVHGENGLLADPDNPEDCADTILLVLGNAPAATKMGKRAVGVALREADWSPLNDLV